MLVTRNSPGRKYRSEGAADREAGYDDPTSNEELVRNGLPWQVGVRDAGVPTHEAPPVGTDGLQLTGEERDGSCTKKEDNISKRKKRKGGVRRRENC